MDDLVAVPGGFVLVGTDGAGRATAWTSTDGATWQPHRMGGQGSPASVASKGGTVVAVGSRDDAYATWISTDRGQTWSRGTTPPKPADDGDFSRTLNDVTATEDGFTAIGSYSAEEWQPVTYTSRNGRSWRLGSLGDQLAHVSSSGGALIRGAGGDRQVAVTQEYLPTEQPQLWARRGRVWQPARTPLDAAPERLEAGEWSIADLVPGGDAWVAAASRSTNGQVVTELWRSTDDGRTYAQVPRPDAALNQPVAQQLLVARAGEETLVLGDSRRRPVVWTRIGAQPFGPARLVSARGSDRLAGAASGPKGVLAFGSRTADGSDAAVVWRRQGGRWADTAAGIFSAANNRYASSEIRAVAWLRNRWVAVGSTSDNGDLNRSALVATSTDGRTWTKGRAARTYTGAGGDVWYAITDLQGDHETTRAMHDVVAVGDRLLAVGAASEGEEREAAVWTSGDARTWSLRRLPLNGLAWSSMSAVAARGATIVAIGAGATSDSAPARLVSWRSGDGGRTWTQQLLGAELDPEQPQVIALANGFALISETGDRTRRPVLLLSGDGRTWRPRAVDAVTQQPGEGLLVVDALADGDDLRLLTRTVNRAGSGGRLVVQPTR